mmetsp:Transcript_1825/g.5433  ORF Transcript_1825/g.5433 Transcript_1825/m.5433 type:complete len:265 (-) Transcript_1825:92-886(-)
MVWEDASIGEAVSRGERALAAFETNSRLLLQIDPPQIDPPSGVTSRGSADGAWTSRSLLKALQGWERRIDVLVTAAKEQASDVGVAEMAATEVAVRFVLGDQRVSPTEEAPRTYYAQILYEIGVLSFCPSKAPRPGPFVPWQAFVSVAAQKIQGIIGTTATKYKVDNLDDNALTDTLPEVGALMATIVRVASPCKNAANLLYEVSGAILQRRQRLLPPPPVDDATRPAKNTTPSFFRSFPARLSALFENQSSTTSTVASKPKQQ